MDEDDKKLPKKFKLPGRLGAIKTFFDAATNLINRGVSKEGIINFAKQEFGEVSDLMLARINQLFRKKESGTLDPFKRQPIDQEGNVIEASFRPGMDKKGKVVEESPSQASGIMSLKGDETFDELLEMEKQSPLMERLSKKVESLQKGVNMTSGLTRTIAREILMNKGIQIAKGIDPIELLNRKFGAKVVSDVSDLADELIEMERAGTPTKNLNVILKQEGLLDMKIPGEKPTGLTDEELQEIQKAIDEEDILLKFDPKDREPNAMGGINRIGFEDGTKKSFIKKIPRIGKLASGLETIMKKFGTDAITTADKIKQPPKKTEVLAREFEARERGRNETQRLMEEAEGKFAKPKPGKMEMKGIGTITTNTDFAASLKDPKLFDPDAKNIYGDKVKTGDKFYSDMETLYTNMVARKKREMVDRDHPNYEILQSSLRDAEDSLEAIKITRALGGNENMFDKLRTSNLGLGKGEKRTPIEFSNYVDLPDDVDPRDTILPMGENLAPQMKERFELKRKFPGIDDETLNAILDMDMDKKASLMADMKMGMKLLDEGKGVDEIKDILTNASISRKKNSEGGLNYLMGM